MHHFPRLRAPLWLVAAPALLATPLHAQDAAKGAALYMRLGTDVRSCVACHGPDPGQNHNNILRAADNPAALTRVLNTVSAMGFLRSRLSDPDIADVAAFLASVTRLNNAAPEMRLWPLTLEFGTTGVGEASASQTLRLDNPSATTALPVLSITSSDAAVTLRHNCPEVLPALNGCDIHATLTPVSNQLYRAAVHVRAGMQTAFAGASGYGAPGPLGRLHWRGNPASLDFAAAAPDTVLQQTLTLQNTGTMPVVLGQVSFIGPQAAQFRRASGCDSGSVLQAATACEMVLTYTASRLPLAQATLQMRGDGGNPASVAVQGASIPNTPIESPAVGLPESGGGCTVGPVNRQGTDISLMLAALAAAALAWSRRRR